MRHCGELIELKAIRRGGPMTVEGEKDDISGIGQTYAAQELCSSIHAEKKEHYEQEGVGHYGVFNGSRFRREIAPRITPVHEAIDSVRRPATRLVSLAAAGA